jgi:hypothetical protein
VHNTLFLMVPGQAKLDEVRNSARSLFWRFPTMGDSMPWLVSHKTFLKLEKSHKVLACTCSHTRSRLLFLFQRRASRAQENAPIASRANHAAAGLLGILEEKSAGLSKFCVL